MNKLIEEGATFITEHLIKGADADTLEKFKAKDADILIYILTKAIFIYSFGARCSGELPKYFKEDTRALIEEMKSQYTLTDPGKGELSQAMTNLSSFETGVTNQETQKIFNELRRVAMKELQGISMFASHCWDKTAACLPSAAAN